jgi:hypothetical protein
MDIEQALMKEHSKAQTVKIARWIGTDPERMAEFLKVFLHGDELVTQRGAWVLGTLGDMHPDMLRPHLRMLIKKMREQGVHDAVKRNIVRYLSSIEIPPALLGTVVSVCFKYLEDPREAVAIKVHAMTVLAEVCKKEPDLERELRLIVAQQLATAEGAYCARVRMLFKDLTPLER